MGLLRMKYFYGDRLTCKSLSISRTGDKLFRFIYEQLLSSLKPCNTEKKAFRESVG